MVVKHKVKVGNKVIGERIGKKFIAHRNPEHFYRKGQSFGINKEKLRTLEANNVSKIRIIYHGKTGKQVLESPISKWFQEGFEVQNPKGERDLQQHLKVDSMDDVS